MDTENRLTFYIAFFFGAPFGIAGKLQNLFWECFMVLTTVPQSGKRRRTNKSFGESLGM